MKGFPAIVACSIVLLLAVLFVPAAHALTITSVRVTPTNVTTTSVLSCLVNASGTGALSVNVTWYRNNLAHGTDNETIVLTSDVEGGTSAAGNIEAVDTTKGEYWECQATVANGTAAAAANSTAVLIRNSPPTITNPLTAQSATEDLPYLITATATDADGDPIQLFSSIDLNQSIYNNVPLFTIAAGGVISFTAPQNATGNHTMALLAYDGEEFGGLNVLYTVTPVDDPPVFSPVPTNISAVVNTTFSYTITALDEENDPLNFSMNASTSALRITQTSPTTAVVSFTGSTPLYSDRGVHQVNVTVYENATPAKNSTQTFWINVTAPNRAPVLTPITNQTGTQGQNLTLFVNATDADTEDMLLFSINASCGLPNPWNITTIVNSSNGTGLVNLTLTNDHVVCRNVTITARDYENGNAEGGSASQLVFFNITNTNDAPVVQNSSKNNTNYKQQYDLRNLTAYTGVPFSYAVNATDPDLLTYAGDTLSFSDNTSLFTINQVTGLIAFTPLLADVGNQLILITATDANGSTGTAVMNLTIITNYPPLLSPINTLVCQEDSVCLFNFTATDNDTGENLTFSFNTTLVNATQLSYNISRMNRTYTNDQVGNYTVLVNVTDIALHTNSTNFTLVINNSNDAPFFDNNWDAISDAIAMPAPVVVGLQTEWLLNATDVDMRNVLENLTFTAVISGPNSSLFTIQKLNATQARIRFTPAESDIGSYTVNVTVTDLAGANDSRLVPFSVVNRSQPPVITAVRPYNNGTLQTNATLVATGAATTNVTFPENTTVIYNLSYTDPDSAAVNVTVRYYQDTVLVATVPATAPSYGYSYDFFSAGTHTVTAVVEDEYLSNDTFTWQVTITNVNRPPVFTPALANRTINSTTVLSNEMARFLDPDDDLNSDGVIDGNETNALTFTMTPNTFLNATFAGAEVTLKPLASGTAVVNYTAMDNGGLSAQSNNVTYTVFFNPDQTSSTSSSSSGGGGGGGAARVPQRVPTPKPYSLDIITPKPITIYANESVIAPLTIKNTADSMLSGIVLTAKTTADLKLTFSEHEIAQLAPGASENVTLTIDGYREAGTVEIYVTATVTTPSFNDSAVLYINSLEQKKEGEDAVNLKVTYARDFLASNPACGELVQLVDQAAQAYKTGDTKTAEELLAAVNDGCTFLKSQAAAEVQVPSSLAQLAGYRYINVILGGVLLVLLVSGGLLLLHYGRQQ